MSSDNIQRQIEFLLEHQAKFSEDIDRLKEVQSQQAENIGRLFETVSAMQAQSELDRAETRETINKVITEMRDGFDKLILSNEVTRDFANKIASLEVQTSQRVTGLEHRVTDLESNH